MKKQRLCKLRTAAAVLAAALILSGTLSACGSSSGTGNGTTGNDGSTAAAAGSQSPSGSGTEPAETADNNDSVPAVTSLDSTAVYKDGEETVLDTEELTIAVTGYDPAYVNTWAKDDPSDDITDFAMKMSLENKTEKEIEVVYSCGSVNGFGVAEPEFYTEERDYAASWLEIPAGEKINVQLEYPVSTLTGAGITSVDEISFTLSDRTEWNSEKEIGTFTVYPTGKKPEEIVKAVPVSVDDLNILEDNDGFTFATFKDPEKASPMFYPVTVQDNRIKFYAVNKTEDPVTFIIYKAAVDGVPFYEYNIYEDEDGNEQKKKKFLNGGEWGTRTIMTCMPGCAAVGSFWLDEDFMSENSINSFGDISAFSFQLGVKNREEALFCRTLACNPGGGSLSAEAAADAEDSNNKSKSEFQTADYVKTRDVVADTDQFKITSIGYDPAYVNPKTWGEGFLIMLEIENKTEKEYQYGFLNWNGYAAVNRLFGFPIEAVKDCVVPAGGRKELSLFVDTTYLSDYPVKSIDEVRFMFRAESSEFRKASEESDNEKRDALYQTDRFEKYCAVFPTGMKEEDIIPAVSLDNPLDFEKISSGYSAEIDKIYTLAFKKGKNGVYNNGLDPWVSNNDPERGVYAALYEVQINEKDAVEKSQESDDVEEYHYNIADMLPPLCVAGKDLFNKYRELEEELEGWSSDGRDGLFINREVLKDNGVDKEEDIIVGFEIYVEQHPDSYTERGDFPGYLTTRYPVHIGKDDTDASDSSNDSTDEKTVSFETTDLEGGAVKSSDLFKDSKITMINLWATWCGPCVKEMPDLAKLSRKYEKKGCRIIGICLDGAEEKDEAIQILKDNGVEYLNLIAPDNIDDVLPSSVIPTTYFVDSEGAILVNSPVQGAAVEAYPEILDDLLEMLDK